MTGGRRLVAINAEHQGSGREQVAIDDQALGRWTPHHLYEASLKTLDFESCPCKSFEPKGIEAQCSGGLMENTHLLMVHPLRVCRQTFYKFKWVLDLAGLMNPLHSVLPIVHGMFL